MWACLWLVVVVQFIGCGSVCVGVCVAGGGGTVYRVWECVCVGVCVAGGGGTI